MLQRLLPSKTYNAAKALGLSAGVAVLGVILVLLVGYVMASPTFGWTGRCPLHLTYGVCVNSTGALWTANFYQRLLLQRTVLLPHVTYLTS